MIEIKPLTENQFYCPECMASHPLVLDTLLHSVYTMADCKCRECGAEFYQTYPVGHCLTDKVSVRKQDGKIYTDIDPDFWLADVVIKSRKGAINDTVVVRKVINEDKKQVIVLNTLDYLYGHVLLKLYNYQRHLHDDVGLIVIVPRAFEWLAPAEASEVWIVDLSLNELAYEHPSMTEFFKNELKRFDKVWLSSAYSHPDFTKIDMKALTGIAPFALENFNSSQPTITFALREDRWWYKSIVDYWMYRLGRRFKKYRQFFYDRISSQQEQLAVETMKVIKKQIPDARFFVTGIGKNKGFGKLAMDSRGLQVSEDKELEWCRIYAHSHVVIGFHGSNMLLPTAFAAGCIEVLPEDRLGNFLQDISVRYSDRRQSFFYRFADQYAKPSSVAAKAVSMIRDYTSFYDNMCRNQYHNNAMTQIIDIKK
ncbi:MAG: hypothetical protein WDO14_16770 [Bacteroidota bacterium]